jgi:hypothetical protein
MTVRVLKDLEVAADVVERLPFLRLYASRRVRAGAAPGAVEEVVSQSFKSTLSGVAVGWERRVKG